jgi:hypothetical protein
MKLLGKYITEQKYSNFSLNVVLFLSGNLKIRAGVRIRYLHFSSKECIQQTLNKGIFLKVQ